MSWNAPASQLPGATYVVVRRSAGGGTPVDVACTASPCTDSGLTAGTSYTYSVAAKLQSWESTPATGSGSTAAASVATTTSLASDANPSVVGQHVTYTATVSATSATPTGGSVAFSEGGTPISTCTAQPMTGGKATCQVRYTSTGSRSITASFAGSTGFTASSTTNALSQQVNKAGTTTTVSTAQSPVRTGTPVVLTAKVGVTVPGSGTPSGTVAFKDGATTITGCSAQPISLVNNEVTATCSATFAATGAKSITAVYSGDSSLLASTSVALAQRAVSANVTAMLFGNVKVGGVRVTPTCTLSNGTYNCSAGSGGNNAVLTADPQFVNASGSPTVYATDAATSYSYSVTGKNAVSNQTGTVTAGQSTSATITGLKNGVNPVTISVSFADGLNTFNANLTLN